MYRTVIGTIDTLPKSLLPRLYKSKPSPKKIRQKIEANLIKLRSTTKGRDRNKGGRNKAKAYVAGEDDYDSEGYDDELEDYHHSEDLDYYDPDYQEDDDSDDASAYPAITPGIPYRRCKAVFPSNNSPHRHLRQQCKTELLIRTNSSISSNSRAHHLSLRHPPSHGAEPLSYLILSAALPTLPVVLLYRVCCRVLGNLPRGFVWYEIKGRVG